MRQRNECKHRKLFTTCNNQINEKKEFEAILNELQRHQPNEFGYIFLYYYRKFSTFCTKSSIIYSCFLLFVFYTPSSFFNLSKVYVFNLR